jgi:hypothetical protein
MYNYDTPILSLILTACVQQLSQCDALASTLGKLMKEYEVLGFYSMLSFSTRIVLQMNE